MNRQERGQKEDRESWDISTLNGPKAVPRLGTRHEVGEKLNSWSLKKDVATRGEDKIVIYKKPVAALKNRKHWEHQLQAS